MHRTKQKAKKKGRGSFVTFISKSTVNNILLALAELIQEEIVGCINTDCKGKYGAVMDGTVDISGTDQFSVVVRYVTKDGKVHERLLGLEVITSGKGEALWNLLSAKLEKHNLKGAVSYFTHMLLRIINLKALGQRFQVWNPRWRPQWRASMV